MTHSTAAPQPASDPGAQHWLDAGRACVLRSDLAGAVATFRSGLAAHPQSIDLQHALAGVLWQTGEVAEAETLLRDLLARDPANAAATFLLAQLLKAQGRMLAVETIVRALFAHTELEFGNLVHAIELLDDCGRKQAAADLAEVAITAGCDDPRLHAYAGMLATQIGEFGRAREHYRHALAHDARALEWQSAYGLAVSQPYTSAEDPDFALLRGFLDRADLGTKARASVLFALGKAHDDIGDHARAAEWLRQANALVAADVNWSRKNWRRIVSARLDAKPLAATAVSADDFVPIFVVGLPRSGTTLVADRLARHAQVCNRGELNWIAFLAQQIAQTGKVDAAVLARAVETFRTQVRQDDSDARWFIDKQPLNFLHIDLILALFPNARIVHCRRNSRDTALSIWMQYFAGRDQDFAYEFADIAAVAQGSERLLAAATRRHSPSIRELRYETLVREPERCISELLTWIGLPDAGMAANAPERRVISTASAWQARQPVHVRSIARWRAYAPFVPELLQFPDD